MAANAKALACALAAGAAIVPVRAQQSGLVPCTWTYDAGDAQYKYDLCVGAV